MEFDNFKTMVEGIGNTEIRDRILSSIDSFADTMENIDKDIIPIRNIAIETEDDDMFNLYILSLMSMMKIFIKTFIPKTYYNEFLKTIKNNLE